MNENRKNGLLLLFIGVTVTAAIIGVANYAFGESNWHFVGYGFAVPGSMALVGLIQLIGGVHFSELAQTWDSLAGWQRGALGTLIVIGAICVIFGLAALVLPIVYG